MLRFCFLFVIGLFLNESVTGLYWDSGEYQHQSNLDNYLNNTSALYNGQSPSILECASRCEAHQPTCISFFYVKNSGKCTVHSVNFPTITGLANVLSSNYFEREHCVEGWIYFQKSCYLFVDQTVTFDEAQAICVQKSSHLVRIESSEENQFLKDYLTHFTMDIQWIGMSDLALEGDWRWVDTLTAVTFSDWFHGQPNDGQYSNCGVLWKDVEYRWGDEPCALRNYRSICETSSL